jgi:hypothetical protein
MVSTQQSSQAEQVASNAWLWAAGGSIFADAPNAGTSAAVIVHQSVERSLYERANGYNYPAVKIFMPAGSKQPMVVHYEEHCPPDVGAAFIWLKNRDQTDGVTCRTSSMSWASTSSAIDQ